MRRTLILLAILGLALALRRPGGGGNGGDSTPGRPKGDGDGDGNSRPSRYRDIDASSSATKAQDAAQAKLETGQVKDANADGKPDLPKTGDQNDGPFATTGDLEGRRDVQIDNPNDPSDTITDIDHVENGVLWEEKSATNAGNTQRWIDKHIDKKFDSYVRARQYMDGYQDAPIGFRFTSAGADPNFRASVEAAVANLRSQNPNIDIRLEWAL